MYANKKLLNKYLFDFLQWYTSQNDQGQTYYYSGDREETGWHLPTVSPLLHVHVCILHVWVLNICSLQKYTNSPNYASPMQISSAFFYFFIFVLILLMYQKHFMGHFKFKPSSWRLTQVIDSKLTDRNWNKKSEVRWSFLKIHTKWMKQTALVTILSNL